VRLLGVGVSGLADFTQEDLFAQAQREAEEAAEAAAAEEAPEAAEAEGDAEGVSGTAVGTAGAEEADSGAAAAYGGPAGPRAFHPGAFPGAAGDTRARRWMPGQDAHHVEYGHGWVQGSGVGRVTVRFEIPWSKPGRVRTFAVDNPALDPAEPLSIARADREKSPGGDG
jgi:DNA polymerase-4